MKSRHTLPERLVAASLSNASLIFTQHGRDLPGTPDFVFRAERVAVFVHGCYWHRHYRCARATTPSKDSFTWLRRFAKNVRHDQSVTHRLRVLGWKTYVVWECEVLLDADGASRGIAGALGDHATGI